MSKHSQWSATDRKFMRYALELAAQARGHTSPNPMVGAVIVREGEIVGEGYHQKAGEPHAEIHALNQPKDLQKERQCTSRWSRVVIGEGRRPALSPSLVRS